MKNFKIDRRQFLKNSALGTAAIGIGAPALQVMACTRQDGEQTPKVGLYSITFLGIWYEGKALTLDEVLMKSKDLGFDGVEIDGKRPHGNPLDWPSGKCKELVSRAKDLGQEIYAVAANNDFSSPIPEHRECQIAYMKELIRMTSDLGASTLRIFLAWPGVTFQNNEWQYVAAKDIWQHTHTLFTPEETWNWCREGVTECCRYAGDYGVTLALQNHKPVIRDWQDVIRMVEEVNSSNLKVCLDAPIMDDKSTEKINAAAMSAGSLQVLTHFNGEYGQDENGKITDIQTYGREIGPDGKPIAVEFYPRFAEAMKNIGYSGYFSYELCHPLPVINGKKAGIEYAESCARNACRMMKGLISSTY
jgi:sugar phosphate isomerase/epimerase